ncbi:hypothetical protein M378DRAFT_171223 [Amanita muscaria Koide BX008]|uniref:Uncharacterized protein n=1 Tax=Amanita muscaria (strain Koide BX008) TaxID=946122 RepID=A0A0C2SV16_AMAMK|nr:hypothetical protein M378DRAFT_171223 [Amanita muscaria Koide BX008]
MPSHECSNKVFMRLKGEALNGGHLTFWDRSYEGVISSSTDYRRPESCVRGVWVI